MKRRTLLLSGAAVVLAGIAAAALVAVFATGPDPSSQSTGAIGGTTSTSAQRDAEANFLGVTAAHMCNAQSSVFDDPKALAEAFESTPDYPGLDTETVAKLKQRLSTDPDFIARLTRQLQVSCHPDASASATP
jgi:hypothetical protein